MKLIQLIDDERWRYRRSDKEPTIFSVFATLKRLEKAAILLDKQNEEAIQLGNSVRTAYEQGYKKGYEEGETSGAAYIKGFNDGYDKAWRKPK